MAASKPHPPEPFVGVTAGTHWPGLVDLSQLFPAPQSSLVLHELPHWPLLPHLKGAHACVGPASPAGIDDRPSGEQVAGGFVWHFPEMQMKLAAQSRSATHATAHLFVVELQAKLPGHGAAARQVPVASQTETLPFAQPVPQLCPALGYAQAAMFVPSQLPAHAASVPLQAILGALGDPLTAMQVPTLVGSLHAWHCPAHGSLQQTPSAQDAPVTHWLFEVQVPPRATLGAQVPELQ